MMPPPKRNAQAEPLRLTRLRFSDVATEAAFRRYHVEHSLQFSRAAIILSVVLNAAFGLLDRLIVPEVANTISAIRFAVVCPLGLAVFALSFRTTFRERMQQILMAYAIVLGSASSR